jgi:hypothetical protein
VIAVDGRGPALPLRTAPRRRHWRLLHPDGSLDFAA